MSVRNIVTTLGREVVLRKRDEPSGCGCELQTAVYSWDTFEKPQEVDTVIAAVTGTPSR